MNELTPVIQAFVEPHNTVLDLGCGFGHPTVGLRCKDILGIDAHQPFLDWAKKYMRVIRHDIRDLSFIESKSFDVVLCLDVIEHLMKEDGRKLLGEMERIARRRVVVYTPIGFMEHDDDPWGLGGDKWQRHKSGWQPEEFEGYTHMFKDKLLTRMLLVKEIK